MNERGFSLMEALVATVIAVIAVLGFGYSMGMGRGFINRYEAARAADGLASACMDSLATTGADLGLGGPRPSPALPMVYAGRTVGGATWRVVPADNGIPGHTALVQVTVTVTWNLAGTPDSVQYHRLFPAP